MGTPLSQFTDLGLGLLFRKTRQDLVELQDPVFLYHPDYSEKRLELLKKRYAICEEFNLRFSERGI